MDHYKNMCLVKYATTEQGLVAMAFLHGKDVMGRSLFFLSPEFHDVFVKKAADLLHPNEDLVRPCTAINK